MNDSPSLPILKAESQASSAPIQLFGGGDSFAQELRLATQAQRAGRLEEALAAYFRLVQQRPYHAELHNNLGTVLRLAGKLDASVAHHRLSLAADPDNPALHSSLGNALRAAQRFDEAIRHHVRAVALSRDDADGYFDLALCLRDLGRLDEAVGALEHALELHPGNRRARTELGVTLLMQGRLAEGFAAYEARKRLVETPKPEFSEPAWEGGPVRGKRLLLYPEQGLSDALLFVRYAQDLEDRGAAVLLLCQAPLKTLMAGTAFVDRAIAEGEPLPAFDCHASLVSLPHLCGGAFDAAASVPYLAAPAAPRLVLGGLAKARLKVGIYWAATRGQPLDRERSAPFAHFLALAGDPELVVFSLQGGIHQRDLQQFGAGGVVHDVGRSIFDFAEAASVLAQLDLLISIDAPIAHLGAAMGLETWVLLPTAADWRWQLADERGAWYPTARLFRQPSPGDWRPVFADLLEALEQRKARARLK